jgi:uncharacterized protein YgbK (DUF1537 family)
VARGEDVVSATLAWSASLVGRQPILVFATATPETVKAVQAQLGVERAGVLVEDALALALKSGNFGTEDFFMKAWNYL